MRYDRLPLDYWNGQVARLEKARAAIAGRDAVTQPGRVVPGDDDLVFGTGRRLKAAVLFLDIVAFSGRSAESQAEQDILLRALTFFFTEMVRIAEEYGGTVEKNTGDGLMAYFEDGGDAAGTVRAVAAVLTMLFATNSVIARVMRNSSLEPFQFRAGVEYGWITIARLGAARRFGSIAAVGTTANMANKMLRFGDSGDLVIGEAAKGQLPPMWQTNFCVKIQRPSGWVYRVSGVEYPFYKYIGRWIGPMA